MSRFPWKAWTGAAALAVALGLGVTRADAAGVEIPHERYTLPNGMVVILHEDHATPIVVVDVSYEVGSRFEPTGRTGFAHLFEHLMFMGTRRAPTKAFDAWMEAVGGWNNATTSEDRTHYYDVGPPTALDLLLWLEADRLRDLGPMMTKEKLDAQRDVVRNERRQQAENTPYGKADLRLPELLFPEGHPYHHPVYGSHADLEAATVDDVKAFFATHYDPANAALVVAGDIDPKRARASIDRWMGTIPSKGKAKDPGAPGFSDTHTTLKGVVRETTEDNVEHAKLVMAWQTPKHFAPGDAELDIVGSVLTSGKASRLYKTLVYDKKLAQSVSAEQASGAIGSRFVLEVVARPGVSLDKIEAEVDAELAKLRDKPVLPDELAQAKNQIETSFVRRLESVRGRAGLLSLYQTSTRDSAFAEKDLARYRRADAAAVKATAAVYLVPGARVIQRILPRAQKGGSP
jgi:zinc protease